MTFRVFKQGVAPVGPTSGDVISFVAKYGDDSPYLKLVSG